MSSQNLTTGSKSIAAFLEAAKKVPARPKGGLGRLIFALDATASRQPTWDMASHVQSEMFAEAGKLNGLAVQLVFYRGFGECRSSRFVSDASELIRLMGKVKCLAGRTQISRVLSHALKQEKPPHALVFVGDACEEDIDHLGNLAGQLAMKGVRAFMFQEGAVPAASLAFSQIAQLTKGAHCQFQPGAADELKALLAAVAAFASGGRQALDQLPSNKATALLTRQIK